MLDTPRNRRLVADAEAMNALRGSSTILEYIAYGQPPERYLVTFRGQGLLRRSETEAVEIAEVHRVEIRLGIDYPRSRPDIQWLTSIYHPNISAVGAVCLGGYSAHWVPSLSLTELVEMLWDMVRMANFDPNSAYNYAAGRWCESQTQFSFPLDRRNLRDRLGQTVGHNVIKLDLAPGAAGAEPRQAPSIAKPAEEDVLIITEDAVRVEERARSGSPSAAAGGEDILIIE
ncbi:MAG: ubiquitin--protein ligase [Planctomycetes bacterium]|nr:ubiquitin--protein ligase [Planctomycetota bacterium]